MNEKEPAMKADINTPSTEGKQPAINADMLLAAAFAAVNELSHPSDKAIVGWMVGDDPRQAAMYNAGEEAKAYDAARRWNRCITALVLHPDAPKIDRLKVLRELADSIGRSGLVPLDYPPLQAAWAVLANGAHLPKVKP